MATAVAQPDSVFKTYQQLVALRHEQSILTSGDFTAVQSVPDTVMAYYRSTDKQRWLVVANLTADTPTIDLATKAEQVIISNEPDADLNLHQRQLRPYEAFVVEVVD